jgi:erythromycin esterase
MIKKILILIVVFVLSWGCGKDKGPATTYLNLDFEDSATKEKPKLWYTGGFGYKITLDWHEADSGKASLCIESIVNDKSGRNFGVATSSFPVNDARGKKLRYSGYIKTDSVTDGYAGLWWRVDGPAPEAGNLAFDNMGDRGVTGTTRWQKYSIELDIPVEAGSINFGVLLNGTGRAWFDNLKISLDGKTYRQVKPKPIVPKREDLAWIRANAIPFKSADPYAGHEELLPLKEMVGGRRIVALGEATHGTGEFFKMKHRLIRFLAEEMGFNVFAIEANMPEARLVNRYVTTGEGDPKKALAGLYFWTWNTQEVLDMIEWMREYNKSGKGHIEFYGFDMQYPKVAMQSVTEFVKKADPNFVKPLTAHFKQAEDIFQKYIKSRGGGDVSVNDLIKGHEAVVTVYEHLKAKREIYLKRFSEEEVDWAIQDANVASQALEARIPGPGRRSRDRSMAENIAWISDHTPEGTKIVTWAHNGHVSRYLPGFKAMGYYLDQKYGNDMIVMGFAFHEGEYTAVGKKGLHTYTTSPSKPGSVEWFLKQAGIPNLILDIRNTAMGEPGTEWLAREMEFRDIGAMAMDYAFKKQVIAKRFDAVIYFEKSTPSNCFMSRSRKEGVGSRK